MAKHFEHQLPPTAALPVQRKANHREGAIQAPQSPPGKIHHNVPNPRAIRGPLRSEIQAKLEHAVGADLSTVRIHENSRSAQDLNALAYTQGEDVHFAPGQFRPEAQDGQRLIAHEMAHVVQQRQGKVQAQMASPYGGVNLDAGLEREADRAGDRIAYPMSESEAGAFGGDGKAWSAGMRFDWNGRGTHGAAMPGWGQAFVAPGGPMQLQRGDPDKFPWKGTVFGAEVVAVYKATDGKESLGDVTKGVEVEVIGKEGTYYKVKGTTDKGNAVEGYMLAAHVSGTISELNATVGAIDADMDTMWTDSFNADKTVVREHGAAIAETNGNIAAKNIKKSRSGDSVAIDYSMGVDDKLIGDVHTHPYNVVDEGGYEGVAFSSGDIYTMRDTLHQGYQSIVEAGSTRFALVITDLSKAETFFKDNTDDDIDDTYEAAYAAAKGTFQERVIEAVWAVIGKDGVNGISFYQTTDKDKVKFDAM